MYVRYGGKCARGRGRQLEAVRIRVGGGRETSSLSLVNLKRSGYGPFLPARQYIFHNGDSYFHFRHLFFRKRPDSRLKLFREYINHSGFAVYLYVYWWRSGRVVGYRSEGC
jgi:hypothetical protein